MGSLAALELRWTMLAVVGEADGSNDLEEERQTVALAQKGDRAALGRLLVAAGPRLYRSVLLPRLGSEAAAKDALAETYAKVIERIDQFTWQGIGFYPWIRTLALRVALDLLRARSRVLFWDEDDLARELDGKDDDVPADQRLAELRDERAARDKVGAALERIHPRYARAIQVRLLDEESREDAARILGVTEKETFDVLLHRAIGALKKDLAAHDRGQHDEDPRPRPDLDTDPDAPPDRRRSCTRRASCATRSPIRRESERRRDPREGARPGALAARARRRGERGARGASAREAGERGDASLGGASA